MADNERLDIDRQITDMAYGAEPSLYLNNMTNDMKERLVKENVILQLKDLFDNLNKEFTDVHFQWCWNPKVLCAYENGSLTMRRYDEDFNAENHVLEDLYDEDNNDIFFESSWHEILINIEYFWERRCSLGCKHRTKRFHIYNMPRLMDMLALWRCKAPVRHIVKEFIPDFFYDPMITKRKPGRPRKK